MSKTKAQNSVLAIYHNYNPFLLKKEKGLFSTSVHHCFYYRIKKHIHFLTFFQVRINAVYLF